MANNIECLNFKFPKIEHSEEEQLTLDTKKNNKPKITNQNICFPQLSGSLWHWEIGNFKSLSYGILDSIFLTFKD